MTTTSVVTRDGVGLHVKDVGEGEPILFLHEYAGDHRSWSRQVADLGTDHRCVTYAARGYLPSDVPVDPSSYSWQRAVDDAVDVIDSLGLDSVHAVGLSMGAYTALQLALTHPDRLRSVLAVSVGSGSDPDTREAYLAETRVVAAELRARGAGPVGRSMGTGPARVQLQRRDPEAWQEMIDQFGDHDAEGLALTILEIQGRRPSLHDLVDTIAEVTLPLLVVIGDEDEACLPTGLLLKRTAPASGLHVLPGSGHVPNLEQPGRFNGIVREFIRDVTTGSWFPRDRRSRATSQFGLERDHGVEVSA
ncbi:alpha/beta fold hydrolase [Aeromicrobium sp. CTD01-1L150]|uniref:alpha/beta fold hydrolase n=1 Tax=Aeromicrobium sp. CTD01-1L150 TaxID=3341830 RepID=UPI0035BFE85B